MGNWKTVKLSDIGEIVGGATPPTSREEYYNGDIPWITPKDLAGYHERYITRGERNITKEGLDACSVRMMPQNTVLFSSRAPIGYVAIAKMPSVQTKDSRVSFPIITLTACFSII